MIWPMVKIGKVCRVVPGFAFKSESFANEGIPVVKIANIRDDYTVEMSDAQCWPQQLFVDKHEKYVLKDKDILIAMTGATAGKLGRVRTAQDLLLNQRVAKIEAVDVESDFVWCALSSKGYRERFFSIAGGAAQPNMSGSQIEEVEIPLPPVLAQRKIADILSSYDTLIDNNRRRMVLLEEAARQLYREWFVRLRFPGHEHTRITNGVPEGWEKGCVGDFYDTASGGTPSRTNPEYFTGEIPWVKTKELSNAFIIDAEEKITEEALAKSSAKLFPDRAVLVALYGATVGEVGILAFPAATNQACCAIFPKDVRSHFIHAFLFFRENKEKLVSLSAGAAQKNVSQQIIRAFEMAMPAKAIIETFIESLSPVFEQWLNLHRANAKLHSARDLLLPRLMSGEIVV